MSDLVKMLPEGGSIVAFIVVVWLFLQQQVKSNALIQELMSKHSADEKAAQEAYQKHVEALTNRTNESQKNFQEQIQRLMEANITISTKMIEMLNTLKDAVNSLAVEFRHFKESKDK